jgi:hypothetical protein
MYLEPDEHGVEWNDEFRHQSSKHPEYVTIQFTVKGYSKNNKHHRQRWPGQSLVGPVKASSSFLSFFLWKICRMCVDSGWFKDE